MKTAHTLKDLPHIHRKIWIKTAMCILIRVARSLFPGKVFRVGMKSTELQFS